jgi:hypothetical protein
MLIIAHQSYKSLPSETINGNYHFYLAKKFDDYDNKYCMYLNQDKNNTELIIGICGTNSLFDTFINIYIKPYKLHMINCCNNYNNELFTTSGIKIMYSLFKTYIINDIKYLLFSDKYNIKKISLCGHSLGGPLCTMVLLDLLIDPYILKKIQSDQININLLNYNSPKFFATYDRDRGYNKQNDFINKLIELNNLTNQINIINLIYNNKAPNILSYDFDFDLISLLPRSNTVFKHIADDDKNMYLLNAKINSIQKIQIYDNDTNPEADEDKPISFFKTVCNYMYYIAMIPFKFSEYVRLHSIMTAIEYINTNKDDFIYNTDDYVLPTNL